MSRTLKFKTPESLKEAVEAFFKDEDKPTMSGLAYALGITRMSLTNYRKRDEYVEILEKAKERVQIFWEKQLLTPKVTGGVIFNLKNNFGWRDQLDIDSSNKHEHNFPKLTREEAENARKAFEEEF